MKNNLKTLLETEAHRFHLALQHAASVSELGKLGIAVSGGGDSLALLLLGYVSGFDVEAVTVDHSLRQESAEEARFVAQICQQLAIPHQILTTQIEATGEGIQAAARIRRYALMAQWAKERQVTALMTAHHADDQAETLLMRAAHGSGIAGLAAIRPNVLFSAEGQTIRLLRPLLDFSRLELATIVEKAGLKAVSDPSNDNPHYDRTHFRRLLIAAPWIDRRKLANTARYCQQSEEALDWITQKEAAARIRLQGKGVRFDPEDLPIEILRRLVVLCLQRVGEKKQVRGTDLTRFIGFLQQGKKASLSEIIGEGGVLWRFYPAPPRKNKQI
ncbi:MAG: tRNA lysidine(34) synthetase TilS [Zymomonas mobilis subsp. pomaceae]|uniref:tRNA(Ile)-lysidine synthase n=1 Tax=Zymomonas mobilis subsp. pomaceae (strain ATCC 29192 / DSM 22645 / JCM 10191 / CCUG 17912 / NBRC 13757 / NCIMB 11200 / NRRL B-4491 / Barker I) TaxID=579138 RepID=F8EVL0_ZYMMT|nr:tRNA lysidine(34) synthetase TilS [Zymomonas mobilis]AEI38347.1 tRNA(Ile)-lysidine synthetase [Zymomonas mobilis subsp. pomaceae ATCC 29192]MDX5948036.1 tRNA lysidine(34) synthetase TilS [Zymomonas mobilis subsp. pomaceae]GEB89366.1 hypothetical protein ZMO02_10030 [Zymomonas mobilis subsp. pomaceae]